MYCRVLFVKNGTLRVWPIDGHPAIDTPEDMRGHVEKHVTGARYVAHLFGETMTILAFDPACEVCRQIITENVRAAFKLGMGDYYAGRRWIEF